MAAHPSDERLATALACAALDPGLRRILLFDASPETLQHAARAMAGLLAWTGAPRVHVTTLGAADDEDGLWGNPAVESGAGEVRVAWRPGRLTQTGAGVGIVLIPDLASLSLPATRACVMLMDAPVATLQRHGVDLEWVPDLCWIAACPRGQVGEVSPHLLDRFALRLRCALLASGREARTEELLRRAGSGRDNAPGPDEPSPERGTLFPPRRVPPPVPFEVAAMVFAYPELASAPGERRGLALLRLARALAQLADAYTVSVPHVEHAAELMGLRAPLRPRAADAGSGKVDPDSTSGPAERSGASPASRIRPVAATASADPSVAAPRLSPGSGAEEEDDEVVNPDAELRLAGTEVVLEAYPEDTAPVAREADSLQLPLQGARTARPADGPVIGTRRTTELRDIAWVRTILEALWFRKVRPVPPAGGAVVWLTRADLHSHRRVPVPDHMLLVVLDYTSLEGRAWEDALKPHVRWAYVKRARVGVVQVGAERARDPLRAEQVVGRNVLAPDVRAALAEQRGMATPLAHGLDLAVRSLRLALQHGRGHVRKARLVVLTDGRGNVPLSVSRAGELCADQPVNREGVEDALAAAREVGALKRLESYVLDPQPRPYTDLPGVLAAAMGAAVQNVAVRHAGA